MTTETFSPDWAIPPGRTIAALLKERCLSVSDFAERIGETLDETRALLQGQSTITLALARRLSSVLGASVESWMARDYRYRDTIAKLQDTNRDWLTELPVNDMTKFGWLNAASSELVGECLRFFDVPSVPAWRASYGNLLSGTAFRTSQSFESQPGAVAAWLRAGELEAASMTCEPWDAERFRVTLSEVRGLTRLKDPDRFLPKLRQLCAESGVAIAVVRAPNGCRASGATRFVSADKAVLQLSFRFLTDDQFWFTVFHEAGHLLLHGRSGFFLEESGTPETTQEDEASDFAVRTLIPPEEESAMLRLPANKDAVIRFARRVGIAPGVVVGQLQRRGKLRQDYLNGLKRRFTWDEYEPIIRGKT